ncbi:MAG: acyl-CoA dehydrogenase family protein [Desulfobacterales bacterium]
MDFGFTKDQDLIRKSAREFFEKECPKEKVRELKTDKIGYDSKMWKKLAGLGYMGLVIPEEYHGTEGEYLDLMIFMEEMGRNIVPCPFFTTVCQCAPAIQEFGTKNQKKAILPKIAEKGEVWSYAVNEAAANWEASDIRLFATPDGDGFVLNGTKMFVPYATSAKKLLVVARTRQAENPEDGVTVFITDANAEGIEIEEIPTAARDMKCEVRFNNVRVGKEDVVGEVDAGWQVVDYVLQYGAVLKAAEMSGGVQEALDIANNYAKERYQFGKQIGSFQSLQHRLVNMLTEVDGLKNLVYEAAWNMNEGTPDRMLNSMVKVKANKAYHRVCYDAVYIHGAIGWTEEMDISLYLLRAKANENDCGGTDFHNDIIAEELENYEPDFLSMM